MKCMECGTEFKSEKALHCHLKAHGMNMAEYYTKHYPRRNKLTGGLLPFKNKNDYFGSDFSSRSQLLKWCETAQESEVRQYIIDKLHQRVKDRELKRGPTHNELKISGLPSVDFYIKHFGSYSSACEKVGVEPIFFKRLPDEFWQILPDIKIFIDTREQQPLFFDKSESMKLDFGDYTAAGDDYNYTYIDRKSGNDFISTLSLRNLERFRAELVRARDLDSYLFVVIESSLDQLYSYIKSAQRNKFGPQKTNLKFIYHNMRELSHEFAGHCQFVFTGSREKSEDIIKRILYYGPTLWNVDLQYYIDKNELE